MIKTIKRNEKEVWNQIVKSFKDWDIYYLYDYAISFMKHGDGEPLLLYYEDNVMRLCEVVMINDIGKSKAFKMKIPLKKYYDLATPYGYGGPLFEGNTTEESIQCFKNELIEYAGQNNIISHFVRFHPLLKNQNKLSKLYDRINLKDTIYIDTSSLELINKNMDSKNRNMVRKAIKNGVEIIHDQGQHLDEFIEIYESTMEKHSADTYYYFDYTYYEYIKNELKDNVIFFYAVLDTKIISASIFFYNDYYMHYHLSGTLKEYKKLASVNLLLKEAAEWACKKGIKKFHLGGGVENKDNLFKFKKQFNKQGYCPFYIGRIIYNESIFNYLCNIRLNTNKELCKEVPFLIQYRAKEEKTVFIIAEAGDNHNGNYNLALKLVDAAVEAGADCVKFQTFITEEVISKKAEKANYQKEATDKSESQYEMVKKLELSFDQFTELNAYCKKRGIIFASTPFDIPSIEFLETLDLPFFKIPSGEITNLPYLIEIAKKNRDVILSTGMSSMEEIRDAVDIIRKNGTGSITLMHCNTEYPTPMEDVNLRAMNTMADKFHLKVGYSDHTLGIEVPIAAVAMGAKIIEKHFTLDRNMEGPDHQASLEPLELKKMISSIRNIERALGSDIKKPSPSEKKNIEIARKSIVARKKIALGEEFTEENLAVKRPGTGISPMKWFEILGTKSNKMYDQDELIEV